MAFYYLLMPAKILSQFASHMIFVLFFDFTNERKANQSSATEGYLIGRFSWHWHFFIQLAKRKKQWTWNLSRMLYLCYEVQGLCMLLLYGVVLYRITKINANCWQHAPMTLTSFAISNNVMLPTAVVLPGNQNIDWLHLYA